MKIKTARIDKETLINLPDYERIFFLLAGHFLNEVLILSRLQIAVANSPTGDVAEQARLTQGLFVTRLTAGKLYEAWQVIRKFYHRRQDPETSSLGEKYRDELSSDAQSALKQLGKYFGRSNNLIKRARTKYAFHYAPDEVLRTLENMSNDDEFEFYLTEQRLNSLYYLSEVAMTLSMLNVTEASDQLAALEAFNDDVMDVQRWMLKFFENIMRRILVSNDLGKIIEEKEMGPLPTLDQISFPFFVEPVATR